MRHVLPPGTGDVTHRLGTSERRVRGFTFIEALIVMIFVGLLTLFAIPLLSRSLNAANVRNARTLSIGMYARARASALETGRITNLDFAGNVALIRAQPRLVPLAGSTEDTLGQPQNLNALYGVTVTGNPSTSLWIDPRGLASSTATTIYFSKDGRTDSMSVSGYGRVVK